jgi:hypothetical protein
MVQYIVKLAEAIVGHAERGETAEALALRSAFAEELDRLDPRDFLPAAQYDFVIERNQARRWAQRTTMAPVELPRVGALAKRVIEILSQYGGLESRVSMRSFVFLVDKDLRQIIERDYRELSLSVFPSGSWKSTVVLAGSILEAILYDQLSKDFATKQAAVSSSKAPKDKSGTVKDLDAGEWRLVDLIEVATAIGLLPADRSKSIDQVLRDYRNFVHPKKELRSKYPCTEAEAMMAMGALEAVCNVLTP